MTSKTDRPNILLILTDQQRWDSLSCVGNPVVHTPNLDRLAATGTVFRRATCAYPLCGPSRASLLTGLFSHGHDFRRNAEIAEPGMSESLVTVDERLLAAGYAVRYVGKWHTGSSHRECYEGGLPDYAHEYKRFADEAHPCYSVPDGWRIDRYTGREYRPVPLDKIMLRCTKERYDMPHHNEAGESPFPAEHSLSAWTVSGAVDYLRRAPAAPFALTCSILHPHAPLIASRPYFGMFDPDSIPPPANIHDDCRVRRPSAIPEVFPLTGEGLGMYLSLYYGLVKEVDDQVGRLLDALEVGGLSDHTLVVFTSDHGELAGSHGTFSKMKLFEEALRVPLIMRLPGVVASGRICDGVATGADVAPTLLDFAGVDLPAGAAHGRSLRDLTRQDGGSDSRQFGYSEMASQRAVRSNEWKLVLNPLLEGNLLEPVMLYDLADDPGEQRNLLVGSNRSGRTVAVAQRLRGELLAIMEDLGAPAADLDRYATHEL